MALDPQLVKLFESMKKLPPQPRLWELSPVEARQFYKTMRPLDPENVAIGKMEDRMIPSGEHEIPIRIYTPVAAGGGPLPALVYYHGGGWVIGDLETHDTLCRSLANESGCRIIAVDYRLAPEHPFPAALDDAFAAVKWVEDYATEIGVDPNFIAVGGDSAGGNLAAVVCQLAKAAKAPHIAFQLLIYPVADLDFETQSYKDFAKGYILETRSMDYFAQAYLGDVDRADPRVAPLRAEQFSGLPPAYIATAGFDVLRDEGRAYAEALKAAGVAVEYVNYEGMIHGFFNMQAALDVARDAVKAAGAALKEALS